MSSSAACALGLLAVGAAAVVWVLARFWGANPEYADRFLILAGAGWAAWNTRPELAALPARPTRLGYVPLLLGTVAFPVGWFLQAQVAPRPVTIWWLAGAWLAAAVGFVLVLGGWRHLRRLAFPLVFVLFALPIPNRILFPLQIYLQTATTTAAAAVLPVLGVPVERSGFVLSLPGGDLGVAEACSGVRSVTALTAIAAFVAHLRGFGPVRGLILLALSVPVVAAVNATRVVVSGLLQEYVGAAFIRGGWHEALGIAMVLLGLALVVGLARLIGRKTDPSPEPGAQAEGGPESATPCVPSFLMKGVGGVGPCVLLVLATAGTVVAQVAGTGSEQELMAAAPIDQVPYRLGSWQGEDAPVPDYVREMLTFDAATYRVYRDLGYEAHVWVIYWSSRNAVKGYHHPDVCWPNRGFRQSAREVVPLAVGGGIVPVTAREFAKGRDRQLVLYWTQEGRHVWTEDDERAALLTSDSQHDWLGERLFGRGRPEASGRLVVLIGTQTWGDGAAIRGQTLEFARLLASAVYRVCPWAAVGPPQ